MTSTKPRSSLAPRLAPLVLAAAALPLALPPAAAAQEGGPAPLPTTGPMSTRMAQKMAGLGDEMPAARIVFYHGEGEELCVFFGSRRGPRQVHPRLVTFTRTLREGRKWNRQRLDFGFGKQPEAAEGQLHVWEECVASERPSPTVSEDQVEVMLRRPRKDNVIHHVETPPPGGRWGIDVQRLSDGNVWFTMHIPPPESE